MAFWRDARAWEGGGTQRDRYNQIKLNYQAINHNTGFQGVGLCVCVCVCVCVHVCVIPFVWLTGPMLDPETGVKMALVLPTQVPPKELYLTILTLVLLKGP